MLTKVMDLQRQEKEFKILIEWLIHKKELPEGVMMLASPAKKYYWINKNVFLLRDDIVWRKKPEMDNKVLLIPKTMKRELIEINYNIPAAGHAGIDRTILKLKGKYFWYGMSRNVKQYIASCKTCIECKKLNRYLKCPMTNYDAGTPMEGCI